MFASGTQVITKGAHQLLINASDNAGNNRTIQISFTVYHSSELVTSASEVQYSDKSMLTATVSSHGVALANKSVTFSVNGLTVGSALTNTNGIASTLYPAMISAGTNTISAAFAQDDAAFLRSSTAVASLTVAAENATLSYTGDLIVAYPAIVKLGALLTQENDGLPGDLTQARVKFDIVCINGNGTTTPAGSFTESCDLNGIVIKNVSLATGVYAVTVSLVADGYFTSANADAFFPVYDPASGMATGGGWYSNNNIAQGNLGRANYGFNVKNKNGVVSGSLEFQCKDNGIDLKGTAMNWLVINGTTAQFQGMGTIKNQPGMFSFQMTCVDNKLNNSPDVITVKIWQGSDLNTAPVYQCQNVVVSGGDLTVK